MRKKSTIRIIFFDIIFAALHSIGCVKRHFDTLFKKIQRKSKLLIETVSFWKLSFEISAAYHFYCFRVTSSIENEPIIHLSHQICNRSPLKNIIRNYESLRHLADALHVHVALNAPYLNIIYRFQSNNSLIKQKKINNYTLNESKRIQDYL